MLSALVLIGFLVDPLVHDIEGQKFVCFDKQWAQELLQLRLDVPKLEKEIAALEELILNRNQQIKSYDVIIENDRQQIVELSEEIRLLNKQIQNENVWWKNRWFIFGVGIVGGIASSIGIVYLINTAVGK